MADFDSWYFAALWVQGSVQNRVGIRIDIPKSQTWGHAGWKDVRSMVRTELQGMGHSVPSGYLITFFARLPNSGPQA